MKYATFIHNDDMKCFHVVIQRTHKLIMLGRINFEDHVLIKRWWASKKMNVMGGMFKGEKKNEVIVKSSLCLLLEIVNIFEVLEIITT